MCITFITTLSDRPDERKAEIKPALRRFLNTYSFYSGSEFDVTFEYYV
jgi:hypothetical protein